MQFLRSVSYTHLDVYKRQPLDSPLHFLQVKLNFYTKYQAYWNTISIFVASSWSNSSVYESWCSTVCKHIFTILSCLIGEVVVANLLWYFKLTDSPHSLNISVFYFKWAVLYSYILHFFILLLSNHPLFLFMLSY